jgi:hypothetical protein
LINYCSRMKSKVTQTASEKTLSQSRQGREDNSSFMKREITRLIESKLNISSVQKLPKSITGKTGSAGIIKLHDRSNIVAPKSKIVVRNKEVSRSVDEGWQLRSKNVKILTKEKDTIRGSKVSNIRLQLEA